MRIIAAMLADAAHVQGGKLYVLGGGFDTITTRQIPSIHRNLTLVLVAEIEPDERHRDLDLAIRLVDEDGQTLPVGAKGKLRVRSHAQLPPGAVSTVPLVSPFHNIRFPEPKGYAFAVEHDDEEIARVSFRVVLAEST
ncbi:MAG: hypothetical protein ACE5E8_00135 [Acidimicrobiia bacterium]